MENVLVNKQTKNIVTGEFSASEAKDIVSNLIIQKINFHNLRNFISQERFGKPDEDSLQRMEELKESRQHLFEIINSAREGGKTIKIESDITIELK